MEEWKVNNSQLSTHNSQLIPPGYKQTEVGVIPEDWEVVPLRDLVRDGEEWLFRPEWNDKRGTSATSASRPQLAMSVGLQNKATVKYELRAMQISLANQETYW